MIIKDDFSEVYTASTLKRPMTPGKWVGGVSYRPITRIKMTCGGGRGGSVWYEYIERLPLETIANLNGGAVFKTWDGREAMLNASYIVKAEQYTVASAVLDSQNPNYPQGKYKYCCLVEDGHRLMLVE